MANPSNPPAPGVAVRYLSARKLRKHAAEAEIALNNQAHAIVTLDRRTRLQGEMLEDLLMRDLLGRLRWIFLGR